MATTTSKSRRDRRNRTIQNVKTGGDLIMYIGRAALTIPAVQKARENQNGLMGACAIGAGAIISMGLGKLTSNIFHKVVDKAVDFWDDVKPAEKPEENEEPDEDEEAE